MARSEEGSEGRRRRPRPRPGDDRERGAGGADRAAPGRRRSPLIAGGGEVKAGRELAGAIGRRIACAPHLPDACRHHPLVPAYGWPLARLARALAPPPEALPGRRRPAARPGRLPPLPPRELRRRRRPPPHRLQPPHHRLHPARRPPPLRRHGRARLLGVPPDPRLARRPPHRDRGRRRSRRRHRSPRVPGPGPGPPRDPPRPQPLRLPRRRNPAVAVAGRSPLPRLVGLSRRQRLESPR